MQSPQSFEDIDSLSIDLRRYFALLLHWSWLIILTVVLTGTAAYLVSSRMTPVYQATTAILINQAPSTRASDYAALLTSERLTQTYSQLLTKRPVLQGVVDALQQDYGITLAIEDLNGAIDVTPVQDTQLIEIKVRHTNPVLAAQIANELVAVFSRTIQDTQTARYAETKTSLQQQLEDLGQRIEADSLTLQSLGETPQDQAERNRLETQLSQNRQLYASLLQTFEQVRLAEAESISTVIQADPATVPERPIRPNVMQNTLLAAIVGAMLAVGGIFLVEALDETVKSPEDVMRNTNLPVLGVVAAHQTSKGELITATQPRSPVAEAFRSLRTNIQFASVDHPIQTLLVTSALPSEGKSTVAANLAIALAQSGKRVVLLEADLRRPSVHRYLNVPNRLGLSAIFVQPQVYLDGNLQGTRVPNLKVLTSGDLPPNPSELLGSERMQAIMRQIREQADILVLDTPPVMAVTDAVVLASRVDGILLVVKPGSTKTSALQTAVEQLRRVGANVIGVVLNEVQVQGFRYRYYSNSYYYYGYHEYYGQDGSKKKKRRPAHQKSKETITPGS
ncbi:MAG: hypothetical protein Fur0018_04530 [Anaerolineales bacterium]